MLHECQKRKNRLGVTSMMRSQLRSLFGQMKSRHLLLLVAFVAGAFLLLPADSMLMAQDAASDAPVKRNVLSWLLGALGWYTLVFLLLSLTFFSFLVMNIIASRRDHVCPQELADGFEAHLDEKQYQEAYELAKTDESFLGNVLAAGLAKLSSSYKHAETAMQEKGEEESLKMDHRLSYLALIGTISPMIGLFGTVHGMIESFWAIATAGAKPDPAKLADGISTALLTTLIGLAIAIPAIAAFNILRNRTQQMILEVGITSDRLMGRFENVGGGGKPPASVGKPAKP